MLKYVMLDQISQPFNSVLDVAWFCELFIGCWRCM